ncbi:helix-turn-helix transcriptional regulator [Streptomyces massasporeus]|uniref:helix-turn-helix transcriptional regulator n=1 Tax=Streptomyces massasporeus TaxID=67324 RepID=UPI0033D0F8D3
MGDLHPLPEFSASTADDFQGTMRSVALEDTAINDMWASSSVSTRGTLQRAFASLDESFSAYIRRRRLEEAAEALTVTGSRLSVSEAAALWHFTDSSHFIRAFKKQYHATPAQFARSLT